MAFTTLGMNSSLSLQISKPPVPSAPASVSASSVTGISSQINLSWSAPAKDGGFPVTEYTYNYQYYDIANSVWSDYSSSVSAGSSFSTTVIGLFADTSYTFQVRAINSKGRSSPAISSVIRTNKWTSTLLTNSVIYGKKLSWPDNTCDSTGTKLAVCSNGDHIYTSTDSGVNWTQRIVGGSQKWWSTICSSSDGTILAAIDNLHVYTSVDAGITWVANTPSGTTILFDYICMSKNGNLIMACVLNPYPGSGGYVYRGIFSSGTGTWSWNAITALGSTNWRGIASNVDGTKLVAAVYSGNIYTSSDSGNNWTLRTSAGSRFWNRIASSDNGNILVAVAGGAGGIYTSLDSGNSWTLRISINCTDIDISTDGTKMAAVVNGGYIYTSINSGYTWVEQTHLGKPKSWSNINLSADGTRLFYSTSHYNPSTTFYEAELYTIR